MQRQVRRPMKHHGNGGVKAKAMSLVGKWGNLRGKNLRVKSYLSFTYPLIFKLGSFASIFYFRVTVTSRIIRLRSFGSYTFSKYFLEGMNLLDVFKSTFLEFLLQARKSISEMLVYGRNIHKFFGMIGSPPIIKVLSIIVGGIKTKVFSPLLGSGRVNQFGPWVLFAKWAMFSVKLYRLANITM